MSVKINVFTRKINVFFTNEILVIIIINVKKLGPTRVGYL